MPSVYDCFPVYNEFDLVDLRMVTLRGLVRRNMAVASSLTHAGKENPYTGRWTDEYRHGMSLFIIDEDDSGESIPATRRREMMQRNAIAYALSMLDEDQRPLPDDIILISDADEIPNPAVIALLKEHGLPEGHILVFRQRMCYYDLNTTRGYIWQGTRAVRWDDLSALSPHVVRYGLGAHDEHYPRYLVASEGGWHLSYFGGTERVREKMTNFLHQELVNDDNTQTENIAQRIANGADIWGRDGEDFTVERTIDVPPPVLANPDRWRHLWRPGYEPEGT
jgi:beta-1,4-mannosyl-glycoprotein beta-1,4-N-acetylglucosaminyltransferase